jgi:signal transduction histidine kinase
VDLRITDGQRPLPAGVELSAYRILQEALSNALRHALGAHATAEVAYEPKRPRLRVHNDPSPLRGEGPPPARPGHGILGMRERAAMLGGTLTAGPTPDGGYLVEAVLPLDAQHQQRVTGELHRAVVGVTGLEPVTSSLYVSFQRSSYLVTCRLSCALTVR